MKYQIITILVATVLAAGFIWWNNSKGSPSEQATCGTEKQTENSGKSSDGTDNHTKEQSGTEKQTDDAGCKTQF